MSDFFSEIARVNNRLVHCMQQKLAKFIQKDNATVLQFQNNLSFLMVPAVWPMFLLQCTTDYMKDHIFELRRKI